MPSKTIVDFANQVKSYALGMKDQQVLGAWNLLENKGTTQTINGATFTKNDDDDTVTVNVEGSEVSATAKYILSSTTDIYVPLPENIKPGNTYYYSGCEGGSSTEDGGIDTFFLWINFRDSNNFYIKNIISTNGEKKIIVPSNAASWEAGINIYSSAGKLTNKVFKPMISLEPNQPYVPYVMTNRELTDKLAIQESAFTDIISGASVTDNMNYLTKTGNVVSAWLILGSVTVASWTKIARIPEGYRPKHDMYFRDAQSTKQFKISSTGNLSCADSLSSASFAICFSWITP